LRVRHGLFDDGRERQEILSGPAWLGSWLLDVLVRYGRRPGLAFVYGAIVVAMDVGSEGLMNSKIRLLLPAFTLLLPVALGLSRRRPGTIVAVLTGVALASAWFGAYALVIWRYAI